jgi:hypothetical protein
MMAMMMDFEKHIDAYVAGEKKISPSPLLQSRVMAGLSAGNVSRRLSFGRRFAVAASIVAVIAAGFLTGSAFDFLFTEGDGVAVNDSQIENFIILTADADR